MRRITKKRQKGVVLFLNAIMLIATVGFVGLAVDVGTMYMIKSRLSAAVDAAAYAAGRSINLTNTVAAAQAAAYNTAVAFLNANFPSGYLGSTATPTIDQDDGTKGASGNPVLVQEKDGSGEPDGILNSSITAHVTAPTYFMNVFGIHSLTVTASGTASRRGLVMMLVLDKSSSMNTATAPTACQNMVTASQNFIKQFSPYDQIGLVTFDYTAHLMDQLTTSYLGNLNTDIGNITCGNNTNTTAALELAYQEIKRVNLPLAENVIVLFTDGSPNGVTAKFPLRINVDSRWGPAAGSPTPPGQNPAPDGSTSHYGQPNSCTAGNNNPYFSDGPSQMNGVCVNEPVGCSAGGTATGTIAQWSNQMPWGGPVDGFWVGIDYGPHVGTNPHYTGDTLSALPAGCPNGGNIKQTIAYIPDTDIWGNNTHGVVATGPGASVGTTGPANGLVTRDNWLFILPRSNAGGTDYWTCTSDPHVTPNCKSIGDLWSNHNAAIWGSGSNYFTAGPYATPQATLGATDATDNFVLRPDQPNTIVAASMNTAMAEAYKIRSNATLHIKIHTIYLTGNGWDEVDREFLPIISNTANITALPYDPSGYTPYTNPAFQSGQEQGLYLTTADSTQLATLFNQLASEVLRISK